MSKFAGKVDRRRFQQMMLAGALGSASPWASAYAARAGAELQNSGRHCVILWMAGGPSQLDTFDMKPGHTNGGSFQETATAIPGLRFSEHLPGLAKQAQHLALVRSLSTREGDHQRGTALMRTGHPLGGPVRYPSIGSALAKPLFNASCPLPAYISIGGGGLFGTASPGFLGPKFAPMPVAGEAAAGDNPANLNVGFLDLPKGVSADRHQARLSLLTAVGRGRTGPSAAENVSAHREQYQRAIEVMQSDAGSAFDLAEEEDAVRRSYGMGIFGQGCLLARRLIERGVPVVEVALGGAAGWDTHADNFQQVRGLSEQLDAGWSTLLQELDERGLLSQTTFLWIGEFGRTPAINPQAGRDHFPQAWSCVFAGAGIQGGSIYGATSEDGMEVSDGKVDEQDVLATLCRATGVNPLSENVTPEGRPIAISEGNAIREILA